MPWDAKADTVELADLIRFSARALNLDVLEQDIHFPFGITILVNGQPSRWNPLEKINDALDLSFALKLSVRISGEEDFVFCGQIKEPKGSDTQMAVKRAIVQAASQIYLQQQLQISL